MWFTVIEFDQQHPHLSKFDRYIYIYNKASQNRTERIPNPMPEQHPFFGGETRWPSEAAAKLFGPSLKKDVSTFIHDTPIYSVKMPQASTWSCVFFKRHFKGYKFRF